LATEVLLFLSLLRVCFAVMYQYFIHLFSLDSGLLAVCILLYYISVTEPCPGYMDIWDCCEGNNFILFTPRLALSSIAKIFPATTPSCSTDCKSVILVSLTHLLSGDDSPTCQSCRIPLTVEHILVECANSRDIREKYFTASSLADLFNRVDNHTVIDFIQETHFYHQL